MITRLALMAAVVMMHIAGFFLTPAFAAQAEVSFAPPVKYDVGNDPVSIVAGDFNNDGRIDLAVAHLNDEYVWVYLGNGDGTFPTAPSNKLYVGWYASTVIAGDFNNDSRLDLALTGKSARAVVLLGNGDGTFQPAIFDNLGDCCNQGLAMGHFNNDGKLDLAVTNNYGPLMNISSLLGNGDGTFRTAISYNNGDAYPDSIAVGDFNRDGKLDLAVAYGLDGYFYFPGKNVVTIWLGNGDGTFHPSETYPVGNAPIQIISGDLNKDGNIDLVVGNYYSGYISILIGNGDGTFQPMQLDIGNVGVSWTFSVSLADFNRDGALDIVTGVDNILTFFLGKGDGTFQRQDIAGLTNVTPYYIYSGDLNNDGKPDLVLANRWGCSIHVLLNTSAADAGPNITIASEEQKNTVIAGKCTVSNTDGVQFRWVEGANVLIPWQPVGGTGESPFDLSKISSLSIGQHILNLECKYVNSTSTDDMILTIDNSAPHAAPSGAGSYGTYAPVVLRGQVSDFDGDPLSYQWLEGVQALFSGTITTFAGGTPVDLPEYLLTTLPLGDHTITLCAIDSINKPSCKDILVRIIDDIPPIIAPVPNQTILWPPDHKMANITIAANAKDNSGGPVTLSATVMSNEPEDGLGDGDTAPDWTVSVIDQAKGIISLQLRAERSGKGKGRIYTITIVATDASGNLSQAQLNIIVPHDQGKK
jgi:hypothetical protein